MAGGFGDQLQCRECGTVYEEDESRCPYCGESSSSATPVEAPGRRRRHRGGAPHRGGLVLGLGIASISCCGIFGPFAWVMGSSDLRQMRDGQMDAEGQGMTEAGKICGIIGTVLTVLGVMIAVLQILLDIAD